jgi:uncharacterized Ntn-hydrolase superfamily protein
VAKTVATFSIVAFDPETDSLGVAVQSKFLAVGSVVPWASGGDLAARVLSALEEGQAAGGTPGGSSRRRCSS